MSILKENADPAESNGETSIKRGIQELSPFIELLPEEKRDQFKEVLTRVCAISVRSSFFSGPLPPPEIIAQYNESVPNGAERIFSMTENQAAHRIDIESHAIKEQLNQSRNGQTFGFVIGIFCLMLAGILAYLGRETTACVIGGATIIGLVSVFVIGKHNQQKDLKEK